MSVLWSSRKLFEASAGRSATPGTALALLFALAALVLSGCSGGTSGSTSGTTTATTAAGSENAKITLLGAKHNDGPWARSLSVRLGRGGVPVQFFICAVRGAPASTQPCKAPPGSMMPTRSTMRLEQQPVGPGIERPDSPGWGLVGTSEDPELSIVLSDFVSANNKPGPVTYRVTLRDPSGHVLATSNTITVHWHR